MEYNCSRNSLNIKEYGRHVQKMVENLKNIENKDKRQEQAELIIELMGNLNPSIKLAENYKQKLWDHLFIIADFDIDIISPFPIPSRAELFKKPEKISYPLKNNRYRHLGKNLIQFINLAIAETDIDKKNHYANIIAYCMKITYNNYHKEFVNDDFIRTELKEIAGSDLKFSSTPYIKLHRNYSDSEDFRYNKWKGKLKNNKNFNKNKNDTRKNNFSNSNKLF